jgi:hypothetical protein
MDFRFTANTERIPMPHIEFVSKVVSDLMGRANMSGGKTKQKLTTT